MPRKSTRQTCMNPLFLSWLEGWRDEAKEKGLNSQWTYEKAMSSLTKYPLPLRSGKEAKILENIGDGIAKKLDKALEDYIRNGGDVSVMHAMPQRCVDISNPTQRPSSKAKSNSRMTTSFSENVDSRHDQSEEGEPKLKKKKKEYIPSQRSGAFALLLTLFRESQTADYKGYLKKNELQLKAQPLIQKSFSKPEPGSHYTPWSSMSTLIAKGLVIKSSSPAKYSITLEGSQLGQQLDKIERENPSHETPESTPMFVDNTLEEPFKSMAPPQKSTEFSSHDQCLSLDSSPFHQRPDSNLIAVDWPIAATKSSTSSFGEITTTGNFRYWYVEETGKLSDSKNDAVVKVEDNDAWFLIKCEEDRLKRCNVLYKIDSSRPRQGKFVFAFLSDGNARNISMQPEITSETSTNSCTTRSSEMQQPRNHQSQPCFEFRPQCISRSSTSTTTDDNRANGILKNKGREPLFCMDAGSFEVVLCVDQMEVVGGANTNSKKMMLQQLKRMNVKMDVRKLQLGDFLWVARDQSSLGGKPREVVLDFIIERKRMDDLSGSIIDGRFKEQKFRLKSCGLKHVIYLVEAYGSMQNMALPESTLKQAVVNSQVIDHLFVRQTGGIYESAAYIVRLTKYLQNLYQDKTLMAYPVDHVKKLKENRAFSEIMVDDIQCLMTFPEFYETTNKNKMLSVREMFAKHLMQLKGISSEKALAIVEEYRTPKRLIMRFESCATQNERENLLSDITYGNAKRKIGPTLAKQISLLYASKGPLT